MGPEVMLASPSHLPADQVLQQLRAAGGWFAETKLDGVRAVVQRDRNGRVLITNRNRIDITDRFPDVVQRLGDVTFVGTMDGEIVVFDEDDRTVFRLAHLRNSQSQPARIKHLMSTAPARFMPFDVLDLAGRDIRAEAYTSRRMRLATIFSSERDLWAPASEDLDEMWDAVMLRNLEGLIVKRGSARYYPGKRHPSWLKIKAVKRLYALIGGVVAGKGSRGAVGSLEIYLFDPEGARLVPIGKVGSGIRDADAGLISRYLGEGRAVVVEVEYLEVAATGQLRMPIFKGICLEVVPESCTLDQLHRPVVR